MAERLNLMSPEVHRSPYPFYAKLRESAPVCQVDPGGIWAISRYDDVVAVLRDTENFSSAAWTQRVSPPWLKRNPLADSLFVLDPPAHTKMRHLINPALSPSAADAMAPGTRALAERLTAEVVRRQDVEFIAEFAMPMAAHAVGSVLGLPAALYPRFKEWTASVFSISANQHSPAQIEKILSDLAEMEHYFSELFEARRRAPADDLVGQLLQATVDGKELTHEQLLSFLFILLPGGMETTATVLGDAMILLTEHPRDLERVRADPSLIPKLIDEVMRYESTAHVVFRRARRAAEIAGTTVPAEAMVVCLIGSANRDERRFPNADQFIIDRERNLHLSFGHGVHHCVGAFLGRMTSRVALEVLLPRIRGVSIGPGGFTRNHSLNARGPVTLPLYLEMETGATAA